MYKYKDKKKGLLFTDKQLKAELERCQFCSEKPCRDACPANCSPADFIMAAREMKEEDFSRAAAIILKDNPVGGVCGMVCPDRFCMAECSRKLFDGAINIPSLQAEIIWRARQSGRFLNFKIKDSLDKKVAVVGSGPAGLAAAAVLGQLGYKVDIYEASEAEGGICRLIPGHRLDRQILEGDIDFIKSLGDIEIKRSAALSRLGELSSEYNAVIAATGLWEPIMPGIEGQELAVDSITFLSSEKIPVSGNVAVIGGGATALDCAVKASRRGADRVEIFALETNAEMALTPREREELLEYNIEVNPRTSIVSIEGEEGSIGSVNTVKVSLEGDKFDLSKISDIAGSSSVRKDIGMVIIAIGNRALLPAGNGEFIFFAGDALNGPSTVVEASASGKNAALEVHSYLMDTDPPEIKENKKSTCSLAGYAGKPVNLETDFFGQKIRSPFLLSAAPPTDGYLQMKKAYEAGWAGGVMKTSFKEGPIHIPSEYMHAFSDKTYGNCDNVSGHLLDRVAGEISRLRNEFPSRLTIASTGGPVTGNDSGDMKSWQENTAILEDAGAMAIEYSLSCPQGGEGTEGDIVAQSPLLSAKVVEWVMEKSRPDIPKLFKLTAAVTSIEAVLREIKKVLMRYPHKKAGVTLANTFPSLGFQDRGKEKWENGVVLGMSGEGVAPISYFTLARAVPEGIAVSGNGGPMNYRQAAHFLALGAGTVQFCTIVMKYGYGIIKELENGLSFLMKRRGISSISQLVGIAQGDAVTDFMDLSPEKKISDLIDPDLCLKCGNCARCPYLAVTINEEGHPETDPEKCVGCSICARKCFSGALYMRERSPREKEMLKED